MKISFLKRLGGKLVLSYIGLSLLTAVLFSAVFYFAMSRLVRQQFKDNLAAVTAVSALQIDTSAHAALKTPEDMNQPAYQQMRKKLRAILKAGGENLAYVYTMRLNQAGEITFVMDVAPDDSEEPSAIGTPYVDASDLLKENFATLQQPIIEEDFYTDRWGTFLSGYAPLYDADGRMEGVLGIDIRAEKVLARERELVFISLGMVAGILLLALVVGLLMARQIVRPVSQLAQTAAQIFDVDLPTLSAAATAIAGGDLSQTAELQACPILLSSQDEIGDLAHAFNSIIIQLHETGQAFTQMRENLKRMGEAACSLADGDLNVEVLPQSERDVLGNAFAAMVKSLREMGETANRLSRGDLTVEVHPVSERDVLGTAFAGMAAALRGSIETVAQKSAELNEASTQLAAASNHLSQASGQVAQTILQIAEGNSRQAESVNQTAETIELTANAVDDLMRGAQEQAEAVSQTRAAMGQLVDTVASVRNGVEEQIRRMQQSGLTLDSITNALDHLSQLTEGVKAEAENSDKAAELGVELVQKSSQSMTQLHDTADRLSAKVADLGRHSAEIGGIVEKIEEIAMQTNMLALNAAIEAARAGTAGKGFAVVAGEVRTLSDRTTQALGDIARMVNALQSGSAEVAEAMQQMGGEVIAAAEIAGQAGAAFEDISHNTHSTSDKVLPMRDAVEAVRSAAGDMRSVVSGAASTAQKNRQATDTLTLVSEKVLESIAAVSAVIEHNTTAAQALASRSSKALNAIEDIASISQQTSAAAEEVSASTSELNFQSEEVSASADNLTQLSADLQTAVVERFRLE